MKLQRLSNSRVDELKIMHMSLTDSETLRVQANRECDLTIATKENGDAVQARADLQDDW